MRLIILLAFCLLSAFLSFFKMPLYALTTDEVILLKQNGVSDDTIQLMIQKETDNKKLSGSSIRITEDESSRTYSTGKPSGTPLTREEQRNVERAWEMLQDLRIRLRITD